jgi:hypothetical protein
MSDFRHTQISELGGLCAGLGAWVPPPLRNEAVVPPCRLAAVMNQAVCGINPKLVIG